jgi:hypothetical protein
MIIQFRFIQIVTHSTIKSHHVAYKNEFLKI